MLRVTKVQRHLPCSTVFPLFVSPCKPNPKGRPSWLLARQVGLGWPGVAESDGCEPRGCVHERQAVAMELAVAVRHRRDVLSDVLHQATRERRANCAQSLDGMLELEAQVVAAVPSCVANVPR